MADDTPDPDEFALTPPDATGADWAFDGRALTAEERKALRRSKGAARRKKRQFAMRGRHGPGPAGAVCRTCRFFVRDGYHDSAYSKCTRYGISRSDATDWSGKWLACGIYQARESVPPVRPATP